MNYQSCFRCDHELLADDIAIYKKLVNRAADEFLCMDCLAQDMKCRRADLEKLIEYYRKSGMCTLFR
ncbi:MAG: hypothetical protein K5829_09700 [Treponema sp.]|nr:hypothetical protein [Treponema sp.]